MVNTGSSLDVHVRPGPLGPTCVRLLSIRTQGKISSKLGTCILLKSHQAVKGRSLIALLFFIIRDYQRAARLLLEVAYLVFSDLHLELDRDASYRQRAQLYPYQFTCQGIRRSTKETRQTITRFTPNSYEKTASGCLAAITIQNPYPAFSARQDRRTGCSFFIRTLCGNKSSSLDVKILLPFPGANGMFFANVIMENR